MADDTDRQGELVADYVRDLHVDIIGLGMHGSWLALALSRLGVAELRLWDGDTVGLENLQTQCYRMADIGKSKPVALRQILRSFGYTGEITCMEQEWPLDGTEYTAMPVVVSCADSMDVRRASALWAHNSDSILFAESRSAGHQLFFHLFPPTQELVLRYRENYFPADVPEVACGATGTVAVGMGLASSLVGLISLLKGGDTAELLPQEHEIVLGLSHSAKPVLAAAVPVDTTIE